MASLILSCEKREWDNPFDPDCPKEVFTPSNFKAEQLSNSVKLIWSQSNTHISGFKIERKVADDSWEIVTILGKSITTYNDDKLINDKLHQYRLYTYAGQNESNKVTTQITPKIPPSTITLAATNSTVSTATLNGTVNANGASTTVTFEYGETTAYGQTFTASPSPVTGNSETSVSAAISGLAAGKTYHFRVNAVSSGGTTPGSDMTFTTSYLPPTVTTLGATNPTTTTATLNGSVNANGASTTVTFEYGETMAYGQTVTASPSPVMGNSATSVSAVLSGLAAGKTYHFRVKAISSGGITPGTDMTFTTNPIPNLPTVSTNFVTIFTSNSAVLGGNVTSDGNTIVTERGVCYDTTQNPTTSNNKTVIGSGTGTFSTTVTGLTANTTYYVRGYAINSQGTAYGTQVSFTTSSLFSLPTVTTESVTTYTTNSAVLGGNVTNDGNAIVTERGVCCNTSQNPTTANNKTSIGSGTGTFSATVTGLSANITYYVRAYAINSQGTAYGNQITFTTAASDNPTGIFTDSRDGQVYKWVQIGNQVWMAENLASTQFNDGFDIPNVTDNPPWSALTTGAYCWYNNNAATYKNLYGALYNWYAVKTGKICPLGWHVPSDGEWTILENYLITNGYNYDGTITGNKIAKSLSATSNWTISATIGAPGNNLTANNKSGFSALPSGLRGAPDYYFTSAGNFTIWWSSTEYTEYSNTLVWIRSNGNNAGITRFGSGNYQGGYSVRCVKD